jgi:hypothetical protein
MGAISDTLIQFVEAVYPDDFEKQEELEEAIMSADGGEVDDITLDEYRSLFEYNGHPPAISLDLMCRLLEKVSDLQH